ncbi:MAG: TolC family protein [FCB group bacterium]
MNYELRITNYRLKIKNYELRIKNFEWNTKINFVMFFFSIIISIFNINSIFAQSLDSLVNEAIINNPQLKSLDYKIKSSEHRVNTMNSLPPPVIGLEISNVPFNTVNWLNEPLSQNLTISQMFHLGGKLDAMADVEKKNVVINEDNLQIYKISLTGEIKMSYYNLWLIDKKIDIQQQGIDLLNQLLNSITTLYEINKISQADLFTVKSEIAFNETQLLILKNQKEAELYKMNKLLGRNLNSKDISISKDINIKEFNYSQQELENILADKNPSLKKMNSMLDMNKFDIIANDKEKVPDLMLQGMVMRMPKGMFLTTKTPPDMINGMGGVDYGYSLMASITLPFAPWSKGKYDAKEQELQAEIKSIESEKNDMQREMNTQLKTSFVKMQSSRDLMKLYTDKVIPLYEKARAAQISSYQNNQTNINSVIDSNRMLLMQSMNYYMAQADYQMAIAEIEMMTGISVNK